MLFSFALLDVSVLGFDTLLTRDITKSSALQRAGRAGREVITTRCFRILPNEYVYQGPGFCFRLYTEESFNAMALSAEPEIRRCTLAASLLQLKCLNQDLEQLDFMDDPDEESSKWSKQSSTCHRA